MSDDVTFVRDKHTFKTGFFYTHDRWDGYGQHRPNGGFGFSNQATSVPGDTSQNSGNAFASFLLGYASSGGLETPRDVRQIWNYMGGYVQDDWRVRPNLTINIGLRYEYTMPIHGGAFIGLKTWEDLSTGKLDGFANFDPTAPNPGAGNLPGAMVYSGSGTGRLQGDMFDAYPWALGPRLGFVWRAGRGMVVRASGGRIFSAVKTTGGSTHFDGFILNTNYSSADNSINDFFTTLDKGIPWGSKGLPPSAASLPFVDPTLNNNSNVNFWQRSDSGRPGTNDTWTLDLQKELTPSMSLTVGYSGQKGTHIASALDRFNQIPMSLLDKYGFTLLNSSINSPAARAANIPIPYAGFGNLTAHTVQRALSPFPQFGAINTNGGQPASVGERAGNSTYHALVMKLDRRFSKGLSVLASYVLSKQLSDSESAAIGGGGALDHFNKRLDKSLAGTDQTHVMRTSFSYDLPFGKGKHFSSNKPVNLIIGDWTVSSFLSYESGTPDTVASGASPIGTGSRVFITSYEGWRAPVSGSKFDPNKDLWYDKNAFNQGISSATLNAMFGNATRNNPKLRTPWNFNENVALGRSFRFGERRSFDVRGEAFNVLNRVRWGEREQQHHQCRLRPRDHTGQHPAPHADWHETVLLVPQPSGTCPLTAGSPGTTSAGNAHLDQLPRPQYVAAFCGRRLSGGNTRRLRPPLGRPHSIRQLRFVEYLLGAPGVGTSLATCAPLACARVSAAVRVMPLPEICAPAACAKVSGAATVILAPPLPPVAETTTAVSWFAPLSMVMVWPALKPTAPATGITVAPASVAAPTVVAPAVPTVAITAVSWFAPVSISNRLAGSKARHAGDFDVGRAGG